MNLYNLAQNILRRLITKTVNVTAGAFDVSPASLADGARYKVATAGAVGGVYYALDSLLEVKSGLFEPLGDNIYDEFGNATLTNPTIKNYTEGLVAIGNSGTAKTLVLTAGTFQTVTLTGNCVFTMPTATAGKSFTLKVLTGSGGFTGTFTGVDFPGDVSPTITPTATKYDLVSFIADGSSWSGAIIQNYSA
tara:strand:- start:1379 stop:1954 length:576 start_codon:yes stop_codon:yes gene_type:complete